MPELETNPPIITGIQEVNSGTGWFSNNIAPTAQCPQCGDIHILNENGEQCGKG